MSDDQVSRGRSTKQESTANALPTVSDDELVRCAQRITRSRRLRDEVFGGLPFSDPTWDMLLDLFVQQVAGREVPVKSLCIAAEVPPTTAQRYLRAMEDRDFVIRRDDPADARRTLVQLSAPALAKMRLFLHKTVLTGRAAVLEAGYRLHPLEQPDPGSGV